MMNQSTIPVKQIAFDEEQMTQIQRENKFFTPLFHLINSLIGESKMLDEFIREIYDRLPKDLFSFCQLIGIEHDELGQLLKTPTGGNGQANPQRTIEDQ